MKVFVYGQRAKEKDVPFIKELLDKLNRAEVEVEIYKPFYDELKNLLDIEMATFEKEEELSAGSADYMITLGGDGTILSAMTLIKDAAIPILGINLGRLGFLASIEKQKIEIAIQDLVSKKYTIEKRSMLLLEGDLFKGMPYALNDFTILKRDTSSMITIHAYINGEFLNSYWADGLIVSTPTGSTGYNLSCGGPIVFPGSGNFAVTPVAPHNLNVRPIVIPDNSELRFKIEGRSENYLCTLDSRYETIQAEQELVLRRGDFDTHLVKLLDQRFMNTMRNKLNWGFDKRN
jgi:NAD+ kinase